MEYEDFYISIRFFCVYGYILWWFRGGNVRPKLRLCKSCTCTYSAWPLCDVEYWAALAEKIRDGGDGTICNMLPRLRDERNHGIVEKMYKLEPMDLDEETILVRLKSLFEYSDNCFFLLRRSHFFLDFFISIFSLSLQPLHSFILLSTLNYSP